MGALDKFNVKMIGATADAIDMAEDRELFREAMKRIGLETPRSHQIKTLIQALEALDDIGLPAIIRPSFTLGGTGGGIAYNKAEFIEIVERGIDASPTNEVLIEELVLGWKEFEMEVVRDKKDNCIIICSIENVDPMGVHTGDSITIAPALTLTDKEYQIMRDASIAVLREIGVETGGSNVQFAVNPADGRLVVIEMNPRVSRSSALASKATGFPIAKVAAKLAVGYTLDEIANDITGGATPASFEPTIDYVVDGKRDFVMQLGAKGVINRNQFDCWGPLPDVDDAAGYGEYMKKVRAFGKAIWDVTGKGNDVDFVFEHPGEQTFPVSLLRREARRHGRVLRRHHRLQPHLRRALRMDAAEAHPRQPLRQPAAGEPSQPARRRAAHRSLHVRSVFVGRHPARPHEDVEEPAQARQHGRAGAGQAPGPAHARGRDRGVGKSFEPQRRGGTETATCPARSSSSPSCPRLTRPSIVPSHHGYPGQYRR